MTPHEDQRPVDRRSRADEDSIAPSLRARIALLSGSVGLVLALLISVYLAQTHLQQLTSERRDKLQAIADTTAALVAQSLDAQRREVAFFAASSLLTTGDLGRPEVRAALERLKRSRSQYSWIGVADASGIVVAATSGLLTGKSVGNRPWAIEGSKHAYIGDLHEAVLLSNLLQADPSGQPMRFIDFSAPILAPDGRTRGVLGAHAHWKWANEIMELIGRHSAHRDPTEVFIVNSHNRIIFPAALPGTEQAAPDVDHQRPAAQWHNGREYLTAIAKLQETPSATPLGWKIYTRQAHPSGHSLNDFLSPGTLVLCLLAGGFLALGSWLLLGKILPPREHAAPAP